MGELLATMTPDGVYGESVRKTGAPERDPARR